MRLPLAALCLSSVIAYTLSPARVLAAEVDARPPDKLTLSGTGARLTQIDEDGAGGSLNYLHYFTPDVIVGVGGEHQYIADSQWSFGSLRGVISHGDPQSRFNINAEVNYGNGDENGRDFDYLVAVLGMSQSFGSKFSVQLENRHIDIDTTRGNLPKLGLTYLLTPRLAANVSYADSVGGNLGTQLTTVRLDHYGDAMNFLIGGAAGDADPSVVNLQPGLTLPSQDLKEGFIGFGKTFTHGEVSLLGDYLELGDSEKVTITLSFTAFLGSRGRAP
jgi:hypothetical protein